jgi:hypothetical protein
MNKSDLKWLIANLWLEGDVQQKLQLADVLEEECGEPGSHAAKVIRDRVSLFQVLDKIRANQGEEKPCQS